MPTIRMYPSMVSFLDRAIYLIGGSTIGIPVLNSVDRYSLRSGKWSTSVPPLNVSRYGHASIVIENRFIYVIGGSGMW